VGRADYLALGDWNALCDHCGRKFKGSTLRLQWNGLWSCPEHWEARQPQDFVRAAPEHPTPPFVRHPADLYIAVCSPNGMTSIADFATADCAICDFISPAFDPAVDVDGPFYGPGED
jgi:hypothetical protein